MKRFNCVWYFVTVFILTFIFNIIVNKIISILLGTLSFWVLMIIYAAWNRLNIELGIWYTIPCNATHIYLDVRRPIWRSLHFIRCYSFQWCLHRENSQAIPENWSFWLKTILSMRIYGKAPSHVKKWIYFDGNIRQYPMRSMLLIIIIKL